MTKPRLIAFYLPQYHPIPENDQWWGKGFTEWTNVAKAKPLFKGHCQPHLPADLGFYDLRVPEVREQQAQLAREAGIEGFCYWHYWFAGKQLLERPFNEVLTSGKPNFPFCLAWANQSWTGIWHGAPDRVLIEQTYPGKEDHIAHFNSLLPTFMDERYIKVDDKPLLVISKPSDLLNPSMTLDLWQNMALKAGLKGLFIVGVINLVQQGYNLSKLGFDAYTLINVVGGQEKTRNFLLKRLLETFGKKRTIRWYQKVLNRPYYIFDYAEVSRQIVIEKKLEYEYYPCLFPNWDNTPRSGINGYVLTNSSPDLFKKQVLSAIKRVDDYPDQHKIIFIKSWNEWAEGNYLEPDVQFGSKYLQVVRDSLKISASNNEY